mmetsp:Transcript_26896/g.37448  ORF Transcript_26896/g.37448 Transcript_26896/m.37448 type:complete len:100 (-) Transcript_26896:449-748(-)
MRGKNGVERGVGSVSNALYLFFADYNRSRSECHFLFLGEEFERSFEAKFEPSFGDSTPPGWGIRGGVGEGLRSSDSVKSFDPGGEIHDVSSFRGVAFFP